MTTPRIKLIAGLDRAQSVLLVAVVLGTTLAFGGSAWWGRVAVAGLVALLAGCWLARGLAAGATSVLKSPMAGLGALAIGLAVLQLAPLPTTVADRLSPHLAAVEAASRTDELTSPSRRPTTVDRSMTLRWIVGAAGCLAVFVVASHHADRLGRSLLVWSSVAACFFVNVLVGLIQLGGRASGLYGIFEPGKSPPWAPSMASVADAPGTGVLRLLPEAADASAMGWSVIRPVAVELIGTTLGGPGTLVALGSMALPLSIGLTLHLLAARGSRLPLAERLRVSGHGPRALMLASLTIVGAGLVGAVGGRWLAVPIGLAMVASAAPCLRGAGLGRPAMGLLGGSLLALAVGVGIGERAGYPAGSGPLVEGNLREQVDARWAVAVRVCRDHPVLGVGLGGFGAVVSDYKVRDETPRTADSSLLQWAAESGGVGLGLMALGVAWILIRLPGACRRVGSADRALAGGLLGSVLGLAAVSAVHWTIELGAVALAASALGGTCNRWLAGGTDLFLDHA